MKNQPCQGCIQDFGVCVWGGGGGGNIIRKCKYTEMEWDRRGLSHYT